MTAIDAWSLWPYDTN